MKILKLLKNDIILCVAALLAVVSAFIVPPDKEYISYINLPVLVLLLCLMLVVAGFKSAGAFDVLKSALSRRIKSEKTMIFALCMICFFSSALITNDVALITFVPFSMAMLKNQKSSSLIFCVVMETIAANLGSLITPIGNPQNLYLYTYYGISIGDFFKITLPLSGVCLGMICVCTLSRKSHTLNIEQKSERVVTDKKYLVIFSALFLLCILSVLKIVSCYITLAVVFVCVLFIDKKLLKEADFVLLITFVFFFIFAGNIARIPAIYDFIKTALLGREVLVSALISQVVSNVPAAAMLASFADDAQGLILGTNIGGLGTVIASMASLISYRFIAREKEISKGKYMLSFTVYNVAMLIILLLIFK
ncbi:MAG: citrate transporter [Clostridia bacterium]|nr:citrate transporter [Clostridia bacterium]